MAGVVVSAPLRLDLLTRREAFQLVATQVPRIGWASFARADWRKRRGVPEVLIAGRPVFERGALLQWIETRGERGVALPESSSPGS
jgi:hypothetical protein